MKPVQSTKKLVKRRPAETGSGLLSVVVGAVLTLLGIDLEPAQVGAVVVLLGAVPTVITWWKTK